MIHVEKGVCKEDAKQRNQASLATSGFFLFSIRRVHRELPWKECVIFHDLYLFWNQKYTTIAVYVTGGGDTAELEQDLEKFTFGG